MLRAFLQSKQFNLLFSFMLGLGLIALLRPVCKGERCVTMKAPALHELKDSTYQLGHKCYQFTSETVDCPPQGVVEAFQRSR